MRILTAKGAGYPLWFDDVLDLQSIAVTSIDPIATYQSSAMATSDAATMNHYIDNGFGIKNATEDAGYIYAITWRQFQDYLAANRGVLPSSWSLTGLTPRRLYALGGEWVLTPVVKVFADNAAGTPSTVVSVNVGIIR